MRSRLPPSYSVLLVVDGLSPTAATATKVRSLLLRFSWLEDGEGVWLAGVVEREGRATSRLGWFVAYFLVGLVFLTSSVCGLGRCRGQQQGDVFRKLVFKWYSSMHCDNERNRSVSETQTVHARPSIQTKYSQLADIYMSVSVPAVSVVRVNLQYCCQLYDTVL